MTKHYRSVVNERCSCYSSGGRSNCFLLLEMSATDSEELSIIEYTSLGAGELRDTASHGVRCLSQCAIRFEPQLVQLARVDPHHGHAIEEDGIVDQPSVSLSQNRRVRGMP